MSQTYKVKSGRVWIQRKKFQNFELLLPYGMSNISDPAGNLNAIREPSANRRGKSDIVDIIRGEPGLPGFQLETRLHDTKNYLLGLKDCASNFQAHLGTCDRPDNYYASNMIFHFERSRRGDLSMDRVAIIEGDDAPVQLQSPFVAELGPIVFDMTAEFLSARTLTETEGITGLAFLGSECFEDCKSQESAGDNGYASSKALGASAANQANVLYTENKGETWVATSTNPLSGGMDISDIVVSGSINNHRVLVANGTSQVAAPAQIAYSDVSDIGTTSWVLVNVGNTNGQYITSLLWIDWIHLYATTDDGAIYRSSDGGATWSVSKAATSAQISDIAGLRTGIIYAVGDNSVVVYSTDAGESWNALQTPGSDNNVSVCVTPDGTVFVGDDAGNLYGSYDEGKHWTALGVQGITPTSVDSIVCAGDSNIWITATTASGGKVLRSIDGGASFRLWSLNTPANAGLNTIVLVEPNIAFIAGEPYAGTAFLTRTVSNAIGL